MVRQACNLAYWDAMGQLNDSRVSLKALYGLLYQVLSILDTLTLTADLVRDLIARTVAFDYTAQDQESTPYNYFEQAHFRQIPSFAVPLLFIALQVFVIKYT